MCAEDNIYNKNTINLLSVTINIFYNQIKYLHEMFLFHQRSHAMYIRLGNMKHFFISLLERTFYEDFLNVYECFMLINIAYKIIHEL